MTLKSVIERDSSGSLGWMLGRVQQAARCGDGGGGRD